MQVRAARLEDAVQLCTVVRASIEHLCQLDHQERSDVLAAWLDNKTPENVASWLLNPEVHVLVAEMDGDIVGAGGSTIHGEIVLNYVSPMARYQGVSSTLLAALEDQAWRDGATEIKLDSTATARKFYQSRGYEAAGSSGEKFGLSTFPMRKVGPAPS